MKKSLFQLLFIAGLSVPVLAQQKIGDNPTTKQPSAILELESTNKAFLVTRVANTAAIASPQNGMIIYDNSLKCIRAYEDNAWTGCGLVTLPAVSLLNCGSAVFSPTAMNQNVAYSGTMTVPYSGGNGAAYPAGSPISSTNVTGLTATLQAGTTAVGAGNLVFNVSGTPTSGGTATFAVVFGGQACNVNKVVSSFPTSYTATTTLLASNHLTAAVFPFLYDDLVTYTTQDVTFGNMQNLRLHQTGGDVVQTVLNTPILVGGKIRIRWSRIELSPTGLGVIVEFKNGASTSQASVNTLNSTLPNATVSSSGDDMTVTIDVIALTNTIIVKSSEDGVGTDPILLEIEVLDNNGNKISIL